ncbi:hypothetical protein H7R39_00680 [Campylobacter sp. Marseille-Q3452]|uniref:Uncharacterized protein n=1 Tax=Campylobacter massiliensis TaxID=2762557 RepID=A0A842J218_9BACT|nr:hypothetical protein [Campylobacter massiliensis]MBC2881807.1 hypothetical protein [Campylobacter massiliensis]
MQTLTIRADETIINQLVAIGKILASSANKSFETLERDEDYPIYDDGKTMEQRIAEYKADIEAIRRGELETYPLETLKAEMEKW